MCTFDPRCVSRRDIYAESYVKCSMTLIDVIWSDVLLSFFQSPINQAHRISSRDEIFSTQTRRSEFVRNWRQSHSTRVREWFVKRVIEIRDTPSAIRHVSCPVLHVAFPQIEKSRYFRTKTRYRTPRCVKSTVIGIANISERKYWNSVVSNVALRVENLSLANSFNYETRPMLGTKCERFYFFWRMLRVNVKW